MRLIGILLVLPIFAGAALAATVNATDAGAHMGQTATVEGTVSEVHTARSGKATFIDIGGRYPNEAFTGVIFESDMAAVGDVSDLAGKTVDISGLIKSYEGRPEIIVRERSQIAIK